MLVYLDNCCFNRPYDDSTVLRNSLESQSKLYIQEKIKEGKILLASSYVLMFEISKNPYENRKQTIIEFVDKYCSKYVDAELSEDIKINADKIIATGVKTKDAFHVSCAIYLGADYFLTTDDRLLKYKTSKINLLNPIDFLKVLEGENYD